MVFLLGLAFFMFVLYSLLFFWIPFVWGPCCLRLPGYSLPSFISIGYLVIIFPSFPVGGECPWGEHSTLPRVFQYWELFGCCHAPWSLRVVLTPLYGSCRPWVIVTFPTVVVGVHMLGLSCTCVLLVALTPLYGS